MKLPSHVVESRRYCIIMLRRKGWTEDEIAQRLNLQPTTYRSFRQQYLRDSRTYEPRVDFTYEYAGTVTQVQSLEEMMK